MREYNITNQILRSAIIIGGVYKEDKKWQLLKWIKQKQNDGSG